MKHTTSKYHLNVYLPWQLAETWSQHLETIDKEKSERIRELIRADCKTTKKSENKIKLIEKKKKLEKQVDELSKELMKIRLNINEIENKEEEELTAEEEKLEKTQKAVASELQEAVARGDI